jgi:alkanesulfonate monooxygenase SsuD/methylene tetrahydromethanopterin reductase-like flavin-dependent oxidoreductase (luciferase family)
MLEAYTTLGFLAASTSRVHLGTLVTWAGIRPPALTVKLVTTLDVLSRGRAWLGAGAGYQAQEAAMLGLPFPPAASRFGHLGELLELAERMWARDHSAFLGPFHHCTAPVCEPQPVHRPRVLVGGMGEQRTLPLVARHADACNLFDVPDGGATITHKLDVLERACEAIGRDRAGIEVTLSSRFAESETIEQFVERSAALRALGVDHIVLLASGPWGQPELDRARAAAATLGQVQ